MVEMQFNSLIMGSLYVFFFTQKRVKVVYLKYQNVVNKILGLLLIVLALAIAFYNG